MTRTAAMLPKEGRKIMIADVATFVMGKLGRGKEFRVPLKLLNTVMKSLAEHVTTDIIQSVQNLTNKEEEEVAIFCYEFSRVELPRKEFT